MENENYFIFGEYVSGLKIIPLGTEVLIVNDEPNKTININYDIDGPKVMKFPYDTIQSITSRSRVRMENTNKKVEDNKSKSTLLSVALFGGNPIMMRLGATGINGLLDGLSNNYDKVDYNSYFEITIEALFNNQPLRIMLNTDIDPENFINNIKKN